MCFCDAPRTRELREKRLRWANIDHPASDDIVRKIERVIAEPQSFQDLAKELERENAELRAEIARLAERDEDARIERDFRQ